MFYPENSLKKGGRFHLCWVADSWPVCFASITQRQLWSQDIRKICDDLLQVMTNESGRPSHRFSLRLSSQLMRGLVRLYQKKVNSMITELCMLNARIMKNSHKKYNMHDEAEEVQRHMVPMLELPAPVREPVPEPEERVEEMIRQSGNVVPNIEAITLKEAAIPDFQPPPNDGFGEENPNQALQLLVQDRTLEQMLGAPGAHGALDASAPALAARAEPDHDHSGLHLDKTMERMSDHETTLFRKSTAQDLLPEEFDKGMLCKVELMPPTPEPEPVAAPAPAAPTAPAAELPAAAQPAPQEPEIVTLETLEEGEPHAKRRRKHKLIIDKNHQLSKKFLRARIENIHVDLRCEVGSHSEFSEDIVDLRVPAELLLHRPARAPCRVARALLRLFSRNLGLAAAAHKDQREMELALASRARRASVPVLEPIPEEPPQVQEPQVQEQVLEPQIPEPQLPVEEQTVLNQSTAVPDLSAIDVEKDIADLPTQKLAAATQKRASREDLNTSRTKKSRCGYTSFRESQSQNLRVEPEIVEKENIPENWQTIPSRREEQLIIPDIEIQRPSDPERVLTSLLQEAGLADVPQPPQEQPQEASRAEAEEEPPRKSRRRGSESSETMLGSLDRTKVSLGDSDQTTDSKRFIRDQWGTEGTMVKILKMVKAEIQPLNMNSLMSYGPMVPGYKCIIAARCFTSILKLKQHGFIEVRKDPDTLEILDIFLGPKFNIF
ncbi:fibrous sheath CABYR-binding protein-like [Cydia fagiglandana]|uniref:fibrous sheath CABYR-binding protein-like n=1 Tax=Cydia fagiglandana TaxID=1458189 RepID=UPI002FEE301F